MAITKSGKLRLENVRLVFPSIFEASQSRDSKGNPQGDPRFNCGVLIDPKNPGLKEAEKLMISVATKKWGDKAMKVLTAIKAKDNLCVHDGDTKDTDKYPEYAGMKYMNAYNRDMPTIIYKGKVIEVDNGKFYSGCYVNVIVDFWAQDNEFGQRINANLAGVQYVSEGERLSGGGVASPDEFEGLEGDDSTASEFEGEEQAAADDNESLL